MIIHYDEFSYAILLRRICPNLQIRRTLHHLEGMKHRPDTLVQIILDVVIYYDNREFQC